MADRFQERYEFVLELVFIRNRDVLQYQLESQFKFVAGPKCHTESGVDRVSIRLIQYQSIIPESATYIPFQPK